MYTQEQQEWLAQGNTITYCRPSNKRPEPRRSPYSVFNRGRKKITIREYGNG